MNQGSQRSDICCLSAVILSAFPIMTMMILTLLPADSPEIASSALVPELQIFCCLRKGAMTGFQLF